MNDTCLFCYIICGCVCASFEFSAKDIKNKELWMVVIGIPLCLMLWPTTLGFYLRKIYERYDKNGIKYL